MKTKYNFELTREFLTDSETTIFNDFLKINDLEINIWQVFKLLFDTKSTTSTPLLLKAYLDKELIGVAIIIKCEKYGKTLFSNKYLASLINFINLPFYLWVKFGCCMDMISNTGFVKDPSRADEILKEMSNYLQNRNLLTLINDYTINAHLHNSNAILPALPHALIDVSEMNEINDYLNRFKNIKRKIKVFHKKGGEFKMNHSRLNIGEIESMKSCFLSTALNSIFHLPYQNLYLEAALKTCQNKINHVHYFIAKLNGEFIGYQAAIQSGHYLNTLHGAFNRNLKSNYHAYDILFVKMTEFALKNELVLIDFGAVINYTKQKMVTKNIEMSYFILSKFSIVQKLFAILLKFTQIQSKNHLKFRNK